MTSCAPSSSSLAFANDGMNWLFRRTSIARLGIDKIKMIGETITSTRSAGKARMPPSIIRRV